MPAGTEREAPFAGLVALGGVGDADAGRGGELEGRAVAFKPKPFGGDEILAVEGAVDLHGHWEAVRLAALHGYLHFGSAVWPSLCFCSHGGNYTKVGG